MPTTCLMSVPLLWLFILLQCHSQTLHLSHNSASPESVIRLASLIQRESKAPAWEKQVADGALALQASRRGSFLEEGCEEYANGKKMKLRKALREKSTLSKWKDVILHKGKLYRSERKRQGIVFIPNKFCDMRLSNVMWGNAKYYLWRKQRIEDATTVPMKDKEAEEPRIIKRWMRKMQASQNQKHQGDLEIPLYGKLTRVKVRGTRSL